jgi:TPR repeat protein
MGFHSVDGGGQGDHFDGSTSFASRARPLAEIVGIDLGFVEYAYSTDASSMFVPSNETLLQNRFATGLGSGFHVADPKAASYAFEADPFSYACKALKDWKWHDAARYLEKAIETGVSFPSAHFIFGYLNKNAVGVEQNYSRAVELYEVASNAGYPQANRNLGLMLLHGKGVAEDRGRGIELVRRAADSGDVYAQFNLARWYTDGRYGELDLSKALLLLGECANAGNLECQLELANRYIEGEGTARDLRKARAWYSEALRRMVESNEMKDTVRAQIAWINDRLPE